MLSVESYLVNLSLNDETFRTLSAENSRTRCYLDICAVAAASDTLPNIYICHPGYLDDFILRSSSLTVNRTREVEMLCSPDMRAWLAGQDLQLITYDDL